MIRVQDIVEALKRAARGVSTVDDAEKLAEYYYMLAYNAAELCARLDRQQEAIVYNHLALTMRDEFLSKTGG